MRNFTQKLCLTLTLALLLFTSTCFAKITKDDLCIAGIYMGQPMSEVISKYGNPVIEKSESGYSDYYIFSGLKGSFTVNDGDTVEWVQVVKNCRYSTKAGIKIGSTSDEVESVYGTAKHVNLKDIDENGNIKALRPSLQYYVKIPDYTANFDRWAELTFVLDENKKVMDMYFRYRGE